MRTSLCAVITACSLIVAPSVCLAKAYTPTQFKAELKLKIGPRKGLTAASAAANFYMTVLKDRKNKRYAVVFASAVVSALTKPVPPSLRGKAVKLLTRSLLIGYFQGVRFDLHNTLFNGAFDRFLRFLPASQKTATVSQSIYTTLKSFSLQKGSTQDEVYQYYLTKTDRFNIAPPPAS